MFVLASNLAWLASVVVALAFIAIVLLGTRFVLRRASSRDVDPVAWVLVACVTGGSLSALAAALI